MHSRRSEQVALNVHQVIRCTGLGRDLQLVAWAQNGDGDLDVALGTAVLVLWVGQEDPLVDKLVICRGEGGVSCASLESSPTLSL